MRAATLLFANSGLGYEFSVFTKVRQTDEKTFPAFVTSLSISFRV